jgi:hypothetical protein
MSSMTGSSGKPFRKHTLQAAAYACLEKEPGLSVHQLAERLDVSPRQISANIHLWLKQGTFVRAGQYPRFTFYVASTVAHESAVNGATIPHQFHQLVSEILKLREDLATLRQGLKALLASDETELSLIMLDLRKLLDDSDEPKLSVLEDALPAAQE